LYVPARAGAVAPEIAMRRSKRRAFFKFGFARAISLLSFSKSSKRKDLENENDKKSRAEKTIGKIKNARSEREQLLVRSQKLGEAFRVGGTPF
jgi:DNA repair exonuclease SbcCD ATPase subunit